MAVRHVAGTRFVGGPKARRTRMDHPGLGCSNIFCAVRLPEHAECTDDGELRFGETRARFALPANAMVCWDAVEASYLQPPSQILSQGPGPSARPSARIATPREESPTPLPHGDPIPPHPDAVLVERDQVRYQFPMPDDQSSVTRVDAGSAASSVCMSPSRRQRCTTLGRTCCMQRPRQTEECLICLQDVSWFEPLAQCAGTFGKCHHFHEECLVKWVLRCRQYATVPGCPVCRGALGPEHSKEAIDRLTLSHLLGNCR